MKFNIGDLVKFNEFCSRRRRLLPHLINTYGIIMCTEKHNEIFKKGSSTDDDNGYVWLSQIDQKEYYFYEDEATSTNISAI